MTHSSLTHQKILSEGRYSALKLNEIGNEKALKLYGQMLRLRRMEEALIREYQMTTFSAITVPMDTILPRGPPFGRFLQKFMGKRQVRAVAGPDPRTFPTLTQNSSVGRFWLGRPALELEPLLGFNCKNPRTSFFAVSGRHVRKRVPSGRESILQQRKSCPSF